MPLGLIVRKIVRGWKSTLIWVEKGESGREGPRYLEFSGKTSCLYT